MLPAIGLDNELTFHTDEVGDERTNRALPAKFEIAQLPIAQH